MILHVTTERNREDLLWLKGYKTLVDPVEQVLYDKRKNSIEQFIKTELRKYTGFSYLILDVDIFDDEDLGETIRSITYLCAAQLIILGNETLPDLAGTEWLEDITSEEDQQRLLHILTEGKAEQLSTLGSKGQSNKNNTVQNENEQCYFFKQRGIKLACMGLDHEYNASIALSLANRLGAMQGATVNYSLIAEDSQQLESLAEQFAFEDRQETTGCYLHQGIEYYYNQADENAHFIIMDFQDFKADIWRGMDAVFFYTSGGINVLDSLKNILPEGQQETVFVCFFDVKEDEQSVIKEELTDEVVKPVFVQPVAFEACFEAESRMAGLLWPCLASCFAIGQKIS